MITYVLILGDQDDPGIAQRVSDSKDTLKDWAQECSGSIELHWQKDYDQKDSEYSEYQGYQFWSIQPAEKI